MGGIHEYNGSAVLAMAGKNCVAIASDKRLGQQLHAVSSNFPKVFQLNSKVLIGLGGLATDVQTVISNLKYRINLYELREDREMPAEVMAKLAGTFLYERRFGPFFVSPVVAGLTNEGKPVLSCYDSIGAGENCDDFVVNGTSTEQLLGTCESFWKPNMEPEELFETISHCLNCSTDRDALTGYGGVVHLLTPDKLIVRHIGGRSD
eukprot:GHVL01004749.1.p1 GENE.GHVL01004749.1~~GHVL01004749.1.p1  ORF type:complete len:206 (+),score=32.80 GHVL01004749.1:52-669(+)